MSNRDFPDDLLSLQEAKEVVGITERTLRRWRNVYKEQLITYTPKRSPMLSRAELMALADYLDIDIPEDVRSASGHRPDTDRTPTGHDPDHVRTSSGSDPDIDRTPTGHRPDTSDDADKADGAGRMEELLDRQKRINAQQENTIAELEDEVRELSIRLETMREDRAVYAESFAGQIQQLTDRVAEQGHQTTALQVRASAEVHVARQEAGMLAEQLDDMRKGQELLTEAQKMTAEQYEARISDLRSGHARELNAVREVAAAQIQTERAQRATLQEGLARSQAETERLVAAGVARDRELAQMRAELAAYRAWAAKGSLGRAFGRPELPAPEIPRGLLQGPDAE